MKKFLFFDSEKCSACGACALACMDQNDIDIPAGEQPFRNTFTLEEETGALHFYSVSCMHCEDAPCVMGCPCGSIKIRRQDLHCMIIRIASVVILALWHARMECRHSGKMARWKNVMHALKDKKPE